MIRAANVLNRVYFDEDTLRRIVRNHARSLAPGGLLAICRTDPESGNHASIFRRDTSLTLLTELGEGSEVRDLAACLSL